MCLITNQLEPLIAQEDMIVYKELIVEDNEYYYSYFWRFKYELGKLYQTDITEELKNPCPFDSVDMKWSDSICPEGRNAVGEDLTRELKAVGLICLGTGFHACLTVQRLNGIKYGAYNQFECTIPKGAEYYTEPTGTIVSNKIIINKQI